MIEILTVKRQDSSIDERVIRALANQEIEYRWLVQPCPSAPENDYLGKLRNICAGRNALRELTTGEFVFWLDADVILPDVAIPRLIETMERTTDLGAIGCPSSGRDEGQHVGMGALLVRGDLCRQYAFSPVRPCECWHFCDWLRWFGYKAIYDYRLPAIHLGTG